MRLITHRTCAMGARSSFADCVLQLRTTGAASAAAPASTGTDEHGKEKILVPFTGTRLDAAYVSQTAGAPAGPVLATRPMLVTTVYGQKQAVPPLVTMAPTSNADMIYSMSYLDLKTRPSSYAIGLLIDFFQSNITDVALPAQLGPRRPVSAASFIPGARRLRQGELGT